VTGAYRKRTERASASYKCAAEAFGLLGKGSAVFDVSHGQYSMIDAVAHVIDQCAPEPVNVTLWTWSIADYEVDSVNRMFFDGRIARARLVIDVGGLRQGGSRSKRADIGNAVVDQWRAKFGPSSVLMASTHAKIATVEAPLAGLRFRISGSANLNRNPRFEQFDIVEGAPCFDRVRAVENAMPVLPNDCTRSDTHVAGGFRDAFDDLEMFGLETKPWKP